MLFLLRISSYKESGFAENRATNFVLLLLRCLMRPSTEKISVRCSRDSDSNNVKFASELTARGADKVYVIEDSMLEHFQEEHMHLL